MAITRKIQGKRTIKFLIQNYEYYLGKLYELQKRGVDITPVFIDTIDAFKKNMQANFKARLTPDEPPKLWVRLSKKYADWKYRYLNKIKERIRNKDGSKKWFTAKANLVLTGRLRKAVFGGSGWYEKIGKTKAEFGIRNIPYAAVHQYGSIIKNIPARRYFTTKNNLMPHRVINYMVFRIQKLIQEGK